MGVRRGALCAVVLSLALGTSAALAGEGGEKLFNFNIASKVPVTFYGYVKLDASWDDSRVNEGNYAAWAESETGSEGKNDEQFNMTAKQTRLGLMIGGEDVGGMKPSARVEIDFYGTDNGGENKPGVLLRHAYAKLDWEELDFSVIAGQTSDVIAPLLPSTLNYTVMWWQGNIGYRRPQLRLTKGFNFETEYFKRLEFQVALTRNIGDVGAFHNHDSGEDSGLPGIQARMATTWKLLTDKPTVLGIFFGSHNEEVDIDAIDHDEDFRSDLIGFDLTLPLLEWLTLKGEYFRGRNLNTFLGGVAQGKNVGALQEITSEGGWLSLECKPPVEALKDFTFNGGVGIDDPDDDDIGEGARSRNFAWFLNAVYSMGGGVSVGLEFTRMETQYEGTDDDGEAGRLQLSIIYKF